MASGQLARRATRGASGGFRPAARPRSSCGGHDRRAMTRGLADTSIFIAQESGRPLGELPSELAVSVVTIGELELGVLAAADPEARARRADTLELARAADPIPIGEPVMRAFARLVHDCRQAGVR